jgi:hypothetical protein
MRRRLKLPELADDEAEWRETRSGLMIKVRNGLNHAASLGHRLAIAHQKEFNTKRIERQLGRQMGTTALAIAALPLGNAPKGMSEIEIQDIVMWTSMDLLESSRFSHEINGVHASIAQLADPQSPLSIAWKHNAPSTNQAHDALIQAQSDFGNPG